MLCFVSLQNGIKYELLGIGQALEFFRIEENSGEIKIAKKLREDETRQDSYRVCIYGFVSVFNYLLNEALRCV